MSALRERKWEKLVSRPVHLSATINFKVCKTSVCLYGLFPLVCVGGEDFQNILTKYKRVRGRPPFPCGRALINSNPGALKGITGLYE